MATVERRGDTYKITVSLGYDVAGKQIRKRMTWKPDPGMTPKQIEKALNEQKVLFERRCKDNETLDPNMKFATFVEIWLDRHARRNMRPITLERDLALLDRILPAIGHLKLCKIQPPHLLAFYANLEEPGLNKHQSQRLRPDVDLTEILKERGFVPCSKGLGGKGGTAGSNLNRFIEVSGASHMTLRRMRKGEVVRRDSCEKVAAALGMDCAELFEPAADGKLAERTINMHHVLVFNIMEKAVKWGLIDSNPCNRVGPLKRPKMNPRYLEEEESKRLLELLEDVSPQRRTIVKLLLFTGFRRGEACGLEWDDIDFENHTITIRRTSMYTPSQGTYVDEGKNEHALRCIKVPESVTEMLRQHKAWQAQWRLTLGGEWNAGNRLFTHEDKGEPICPLALSSWFCGWINEHLEDLPKISLHSLRHTNASLLIAGNVPVTTVSQRLGHANAHTTMTVYAHAIKSADEAAAETLQDILSPGTKRA